VRECRPFLRLPAGSYPNTVCPDLREGGALTRPSRGRHTVEPPRPGTIEDDNHVTISTFDELRLAEPLLRALKAEAHAQPTPIQSAAIPHILAGRDVLGTAQTGTGKTAAFLLPVMHRLAGSRARPNAPRALILAPTRELAAQIAERARAYGRFVGLSSTAIFGGVNQNAQLAAIARGPDILIATPGRLLDFLNQRRVRLDAVEHLVLDEADRMLDMGFVRDVRRIVAQLPKDRQSLLFSATMPKEVLALAGELLRNPERVAVAPAEVVVSRIDQKVFFVASADKRSLLLKLLADRALRRVLVFTRTKHGAKRLAMQLEKAGISTDAIHGDKPQNGRVKALAAFRGGHVRVLVATDVAARGIDVPEVTHVINFDIPNVPESYVHRIGRTARAGSGGVAWSFCDGGELDSLRSIERLTRGRLASEGQPGRAPAPARKPADPTGRRAPRKKGWREVRAAA
jgi:ATP-dependent RNA helicase RhlE